MARYRASLRVKAQPTKEGDMVDLWTSVVVGDGNKVGDLFDAAEQRANAICRDRGVDYLGYIVSSLLLMPQGLTAYGSCRLYSLESSSPENFDRHDDVRIALRDSGITFIEEPLRGSIAMRAGQVPVLVLPDGTLLQGREAINHFLRH